MFIIEVMNICNGIDVQTFSDYQLQLERYIFLLSYTELDDGLLKAEMCTRSWNYTIKIYGVFDGYNNWLYCNVYSTIVMN
jgi:hypothetical protein